MSPKEPLTISCRVIGGPCDGRLITVPADSSGPLSEVLYLIPPPITYVYVFNSGPPSNEDRVFRNAIYRFDFNRFTYVFSGMS
ncbi:MAG: hypothetical protein IT442_04865 [Phycisphaeraceae bacterium]|nr:hypothetical protein [Phycisphaeraceae bacterium]